MAIKGLTDRGRSRFPCLGKLKKGAPKPKKGPGEDLTYFRFDSSDADAVARFEELYGNEPTSIPVMLPYDKVDECFFTCKEEWASGGLKYRCDGEFLMARQLDSGAIQQHFAAPIECQKTQGSCNCKETGRLSVVIRGLNRFAYVSCETHSINDIVNLYEQLCAVFEEFGSLRKVPFVLTRRPERISTPSGSNGTRARREKWMLSIEIDPVWANAQFELASHQHRTGRLAGINNTEIIEATVEPVALPPATNPIAFQDEELWVQWRSLMRECQDHESLSNLEAIARQYANDGMLAPAGAVHNAIDQQCEIVRERLAAQQQANQMQYSPEQVAIAERIKVAVQVCKENEISVRSLVQGMDFPSDRHLFSEAQALEFERLVNAELDKLTVASS